MAVTTDKEIIDRFKVWLADAGQSEPNDPEAMTLATCTPDGVPSARMVLLKGVDEGGFTFYTNLGSHKARELKNNPRAALVFHWKSLRRQVRVEGTVEPVDDAAADAYFASRARISQIGAWASRQSEPLKGRFELEKRIAEITARFNIGSVPRPPFWSGFRIVPTAIEFWEDKPFRLHERIRHQKQADGRWNSEPLFP